MRPMRKRDLLSPLCLFCRFDNGLDLRQRSLKMLSCVEDAFLIDRSEQAEKASGLMLEYLAEQKGAKLVEIYGLPLVGKTKLAEQVCGVVKQKCKERAIRLEYLYVYYDLSIHSFLVKFVEGCKLEVLSSLDELESIVKINVTVKHLILLDDFDNVHVVNKLLQYEHCCFVITTKNMLLLPRMGNQVFYHKISPLTTEESKEYMKKHLQPKEWTYKLHSITENCQGFPQLLSHVTKALYKGTTSQQEIYKKSFQELCAKFLPKDEDFQTNSKLLSQVKKLDNAVLSVHMASLTIMNGSFKAHDLAVVSALTKVSVTKKALIEPLFKLGIVSEKDEKDGTRFVISDIIRSLLEDRYSYLQNDSDLHNRFCNYFAKIFSDLETKMLNNIDEFFTIFIGVYPNLLALVERAVYCLKEEYDVLIQVGYQAELIIMGFLHAKEVVTFYEACVQAARERGNKTDYARMLSAFGHSLLVICPDLEFAREKIWEAFELMKKDPNISETEIALTTSHKGHYYYLRGDTAKSIRCYTKATSIYETCLEDLQQVQNPDAAQLRFLKLSKVRMKNNIAISLGCLGQYDKSIQLHRENIHTYQENFKSNLGMGKAYHCIGLMLHFKGDEEGALKYGKIGLDIKRRSLPNKPSLSVIYSVSHVGMSYYFSKRQDAERALLMLDDALAMIDDLRKHHADRSLLLNGKGVIYLGTGCYSQARTLLEEAADIRKREFGIGANCNLGESLQYLGETYYHLGEFRKAVETLKECLTVELQYYRQSPEDFEGIILKTLEWLEKSLVKQVAEKDTVDIVREFVSKTKTFIKQSQEEMDCEMSIIAKGEYDSFIEDAFQRLGLKDYMC